MRKSKTIAALVIVLIMLVSVPVSSSKYMKRLEEINNKGLAYPSYDFISRKYGDELYSEMFNWKHSDYIYYFVDDGILNVVVANSTPELGEMIYSGAISIYRYDEKLNFLQTIIINTDKNFDLWGGFFHSQSGENYIAVGCKNEEFDDSKEVVRVIKYDKSFIKKGYCSIYGNESNTFKGISTPFDAGNCSMSMINGTLIVHTSREMYPIDERIHQSDITFYINSVDMTKMEHKMAYVSHSFNQYVLNDSENVYFIDHGDAYPREIEINGYFNFGTSEEYSRDISILKFTGMVGDNETSSTIGGAKLSPDKIITVGTSSPHYNEFDGKLGKSLVKNIYACITDKELKNNKFIWLSSLKLNGNVTAGSPRIINVSDKEFAVIYNESNGNSNTIRILKIDDNGNILRNVKLDGMYFADNSDPIIYGNNIIWVSPDSASLNDNVNYLYMIPLDVFNYPIGDANGDWIVDSADATTILRHVAMLDKIDDEMKYSADADEDGQISSSDATRVLRIVAKLDNLQ